MPLHALVASHRTHDLTVIERLSVDGADLAERVAGPGVHGVVVLATCNRFEAYVDATDADTAHEAVTAALGGRASLVHAADADRLGVLTGDQAVTHLFSVACGLESMVVGEREISGQVRRARDQAQQAGRLSPLLDRVFQSALRTARTVGAATGLGSSGRSVVSVAFDLADATVQWEGARALIVGTGQMAEAGLGLLAGRGARLLGAYSPSGRRIAFAGLPAVASLDRAAFLAALSEADVVLACSGGEQATLTPELLRAHRRDPRPLTIIDLALHRDAEPGVVEVPGVRLVSLDDVGSRAPEEPMNAVEAARSIVAHATARFEGSESERAMDPVIVALREHVFGILEREVERLRPAPGAPPEARAQADAAESALRRFAAALLHTPSVRAREHAQAGEQDAFLAAAATIFGVDAQMPAEACPAPVADYETHELESEHRPR